MITENISGFEWDEGNISKCRKHGLSIKEIESFFGQEKLLIAPDIKHSQTESRYIAIGLIKRKPAFVVFTIRTNNTGSYIRTISARYMHKKEAKKYEKENF